MNEDRDAMPPDDDGAFDRLLRDGQPPVQTSASHDDAVMRAMASSAGRIRRRRQRRWQLPLGLAAVLVLGVGVGLNVMRDDVPRGEPVRGGPAAAVVPANESRLSSAPQRLSWTAVPGAQRYVVKLRDVQGRSLWESPPQTATQVALPGAVRGQLDGGGTYLWQIEAETAAGRRVIGNYWFEVQR